MKSVQRQVADQLSSSNAVLWVTATLAFALLPQLLRVPLPVALVCLLPVAWRVLAQLRRWKPLPAWVRFAAVGLAIATLVIAYGGLFGRRASVSLLAVMLSLKLLECHRIRDARLVVSFSFFLCTTQFLFNQGVLMPLYGAIVVLLGMVALVRLHRVEAFALSHNATPPAAPIWSEVGFGFRLLLLSLPVCLAFFVLFPRWGSPLWGVPETTLDARTGLSDSMSPGSIENLFMDDSPAFRIEFEGAVPQQSDLYWRGPVFWHYDGNTWSSSFYGRSIPAPKLPANDERGWDYVVQLEPNERRWLFALDYPTQSPADTRVTLDFQLIRRQPVIQLTQYEMNSNPFFVDAPELQVTLRTMALELPEGEDPKTRQLVERWQSETPDPDTLIARILRHFNEEEFHYSLNAPPLGRNAVDDFLFETRTGYCEHYSSAFAVMMRMAGIPSRVVTGYQGGWYSELGDYYLVRQSDAHAWVEVWLQDRGWTRIDPTAAVSPLRVERGSIDAFAEPRHLFDFVWVRSARNAFDILEQKWNSYVIEYGAQRQARLFSGLGVDDLRPGGLVSVLAVLVALISLILLPVAMRTRGPVRRDPLVLLWARFLKRLERAGYSHPASGGAQELALAAAVHLPEQAGEIQRIADLYDRYRYSAQAPALAELRQAIRSIRLPRRRRTKGVSGEEGVAG